MRKRARGRSLILTATLPSVACLLVLALRAEAMAQETDPTGPVDVAGEWELEFVGGAQDCVAGIEQNGEELSGTLQCGSDVASLVDGRLNGRELAFSTVVHGQRGRVVVGLAPDGYAFSGGWTPQAGGPGRTVLGVRRADQRVDANLTGRWQSTLESPLYLECDTAIEHRAELRLSTDCDVITLSLTGSYDSEHGTYRVQDGHYGAIVRGVVLEDGTLRAAWYLYFGTVPLAGTLVSQRVSEDPQLVDLNGDWRLMLDGTYAGECSAHIEQPASDITKTAEVALEVDCGSGVRGSLAGFVHYVSGTMSAHGTIAGRVFFFQGEAARDRSSIRGVWSFEKEREGRPPSKDDAEGLLQNYGCFAAVRADDSQTPTCDPPSHHPAVQIDCFDECGSTSGAQPRLAGRELSELGSEGDARSTKPFVAAFAGVALGAIVLLGWRLRVARRATPPSAC